MSLVYGPGTASGIVRRSMSEPTLLAANRRFYDALWSDARLVAPERFNTWPLVARLAGHAPRRLEVAPGLRPRLPIAGTTCVDISAPALARLGEAGGHGVLGSITALPFASSGFDLVCACDVVEHVDDDEAAFAELARVTAPGGAVLIATPLHPASWTAFDDAVGHRRRYTPERLAALLARNGLAVEASAAYGMQPRSSRLVDLGMYFLTHQRDRAMWWYNRVFMPLALRFERPLAMAPGMIGTDRVDTVFLLCRRGK
jgi:SAM-dependent methyltransferase